MRYRLAKYVARELRNFSQNLPVGYLSGDERHRARASLGDHAPMPQYLGALNLSLLQNYGWGQPYSAVASINIAP